MSEDRPEKTAESSDIVENAREKLARVQEQAKGALETATQYIRDNPWIAVVGAAVLGGLITAISRQGRPEPSKFNAIREWLDEAYSRLPDGKQLRSAAESTGVPCFLKKLRKSFRLD